jgi:DNA ligase (NAD+)
MTKREVHSYNEYKSLVQELEEHDRHYYEECCPKISDYEYDVLIKTLEKYEAKHPHDILPHSPTQRVKEGAAKGFTQKKHLAPMLSLANTYSREEIQDFVNRIYKLLEKKDVTFCSELKMDGIAVSLRYEKGKLITGLTRGNGKVGDDITSNIKTIKRVPLQLRGDNIPDILEVRGEVFMHKKTFQDINNMKQEEGQEAFANPRNAAAGSLKLLDPSEVKARKLDIVTYGIAGESSHISSQLLVHKYLKGLGLPVAIEEHFAKCTSVDAILAFASKIQKIRDDLSFEIDGIVIKVDDIASHSKLGVTGKSPRYAVAYKFAPEQAITVIEDITLQVGRTGVITPVAELKPVKLAGSTIARATLHNEEEVERKDIRVGDVVIIEKGGDVIPKVVSVDPTKRTASSKKWHMPKTCPSCGSIVTKKEGEVATRCNNNKCIARRFRRIAFFASKSAMDIDHLGTKIVQLLVDNGYVSCISDIYALDENILSQLPGFKEKAIKNLLASIEKSKNTTFQRFIMGLEIPYVGAETADLLSIHYQDIDGLIHAKLEDLIEIEGVGEKVANSVVTYFLDTSNIEVIKKLLEHGVTIQKVTTKVNKSHEFYKKTFVLTGSLEEFTRQSATQLIKERGGKVMGSVSKNTDYLLLGENPGSKYDKAKKLGIVKILSETSFKNRL